MRPQGIEAPRGANGAIFAQETEQDMFACDDGASILARFIAREENRAAGFLGVTLEHDDKKSMPCLQVWAIAAANVIPGRARFGLQCWSLAHDYASRFHETGKLRRWKYVGIFQRRVAGGATS